jgi:hypothetical protein
MIRKKPAPHLMRGGHRFSEKDHAQTTAVPYQAAMSFAMLQRTLR